MLLVLTVRPVSINKDELSVPFDSESINSLEDSRVLTLHHLRLGVRKGGTCSGTNFRVPRVPHYSCPLALPTTPDLLDVSYSLKVKKWIHQDSQ